MGDILSVESIELLLLENDLNEDIVLDILREKATDISNGDLQSVVEYILRQLKVKIKNAN